jgi:anti-sigma factor RsiW
MERSHKDDTMRYLLGDLPEEQANALETQYFADDEFFERLGAGETDLLDEYVRGELTASEREAFEQRLNASASLRARLASARAFAAGLDGAVASPRPAARSRILPLAVAAAVLLAAAGLWLGIQTSRLRGDIEALREQKLALELENRRLTTEQARTPAPNPPEREVHAVGQTVALVLSPGVLREASGGNNFVVPKGARAVLLEVPLGDQPGERYSVRIEDASGRSILEHRDLPAVSGGGGAGRVAIVATDPSGLPAGDYAVRVGCRRHKASKAYEEAANFSFHITYR